MKLKYSTSALLLLTSYAVAQLPASFSATVLAAHPSTYLNFDDSTSSFRDQVNNLEFTPSATGTILPHQPGFDTAQPANTSASFSNTAYSLAPNGSVADFEWNQPFSFMIHIDKLQWSRSGTVYLFSKGDLSNNSNDYFLALSMYGNNSQLCFTMDGKSTFSAFPNHVEDKICTGRGVDSLPNGYNYNLVVTYDGSGSSAGLGLYVNGLSSVLETVNSNNSYGFSFGDVSVAIQGHGFGYAASTPFTSTGGGPDCIVLGTLNAVKGVPSTLNYNADRGCTSTPSIVLTSPTGTGVVLAATLLGTSLRTATTDPLVLAGTSSSGTFHGNVATVSTAAPLHIDEFAIFPAVLTPQQIQSFFYATKFYEALLNPHPADPLALIFDNDGCADSDNIYALALAIAAHKLGYVDLAGVVDTDGAGPGMAMYRQMLDQAGLQHTPVAIPSSTAISTSLCTAADADAVNPATPQTEAAYMKAATLYRTILVQNPTTPVAILLGGSFRGVSDLMQSPPDALSPLTGAELLARDARNGGAIYAQGLGCCFVFTGDNSLQDWSAGQYVVQHSGNLPIYWFGGTPQISGPGILTTRPADDPVFLFAKHLGTDVRQAWDSLPMTALLSSAFAGGVTVAIGGSGHGYATTTTFSSTGGGPLCQVTGTMLSIAGVPSSITYAAGTYAGLGSGCTSPPELDLIASTGTGTTLTATPTGTCGTVSITGPRAGSTSGATCSQHHFLPYSTLAAPGNPPILTWFLNSLIDPAPQPAAPELPSTPRTPPTYHPPSS
jgi:hypothetical protein